MTGRLPSFRAPQDQPGRIVASRFTLRQDAPEQSILTYSEPGHGVSGESSN